MREAGGRLYSKGAAILKMDAYPGSSVCDFTVEKVYQGNAILKVNGKWRAVLAAEDYDGPRHLIKKGARFKGIAKLYHEDGKFRA
ncbi:hypothetical protein AKJ47_01265 [candidate division MSBL1 archaeon SCGC-AAA261G05]|nr:hypothetical protein AKJ47_01265 [candidate division MSBL1 archaeon SCGC-AAA261G05]KXB04803.1 hypothetical protein AKJ48_01350 [candidate division MSBL1 archaeon SCGC-AAA261O19]